MGTTNGGLLGKYHNMKVRSVKFSVVKLFEKVIEKHLWFKPL